MALLRYDTADLVRRLPDEPLRCELAAIPAAPAIQGLGRRRAGALPDSG
jgi:hypothetical protein